MSKKDGGHAYPNSIGHRGMTMRDYFAGQAMAAYASSMPSGGFEFLYVKGLAKGFYAMADAMIEEREAKDDQP